MRLNVIYKALANLPLQQSRKEAYVLLENGKILYLDMKREVDGTPYFIEKRQKK